MEVMMQLQGDEMSDLRQRFDDAPGGGLEIKDFVTTMLEKLNGPTTAGGDLVQQVANLIEVFLEIDINGDGSMEWEEFTSFCVEAGLAATRRTVAPMTHQYVEDTSFMDCTSCGAYIPRLYFVPDMQRIFLIELDSAALKVHLPNGRLVGTIDMNDAIHAEIMRQARANGNGRQVAPSKPATKDSLINIINVTYARKLGIVIVSSSDLSISFWTPENSASSTGKTTFRYSGRFIARSVQTIIEFCDESDLLLTSGGHELSTAGGAFEELRSMPGIATAWRIKRKKATSGKEDFTATAAFRLEKHTDSVTGLLEVPHHELLVSCSMDRMIYLWDAKTGAPKGELVRRDRNLEIPDFVRGTKTLLYAADHDLLMTTGFEFDALGWDIDSTSLVLRLTGHRFPLIGLELVPAVPKSRAVTMDEQGNMKLWDISRTLTGLALCIQSFSSNNKLSQFKPRAMVAAFPSNTIIAAGCKLRIFEFKKVASSEQGGF
jgi:hypothetical protein